MRIFLGHKDVLLPNDWTARMTSSWDCQKQNETNCIKKSNRQDITVIHSCCKCHSNCNNTLCKWLLLQNGASWRVTASSFGPACLVNLGTWEGSPSTVFWTNCSYAFRQSCSNHAPWLLCFRSSWWENCEKKLTATESRWGHYSKLFPLARKRFILFRCFLLAIGIPIAVSVSGVVILDLSAYCLVHKQN